MPTAAEFRRQMLELIDAVPQTHAQVQGELLADAFEDVVVASPVDTGAYRAGHTMGTGEGRVESFLYEHPDRVSEEAQLGFDQYAGVVTIARSRPETQLPPPDLASARAAARALSPFGWAGLLNQVEHANIVEDVHGYAVYERATVAGMANAQARMQSAFRALADRFR